MLPQLPVDKANHYLYGSIAAAVAVPIGAYFGLPQEFSALIGSTGAGAIKELMDAAQNYLARRRGEPEPHEVSIYDVLATAAGGLPLAGVSLVG